ncbi:ROK family protein [Streptomyces sp. SBT349]|uniref:ROK family protein n=1 Tax=Streptomyces sp. SBT349 TaxID=1580539 RepID=UPI00066A93CF|nr:ROK family protein [Streptomyces sp. SBT349]
MIPVLDIGGTHVTAALVDPASAVVTDRRREPLDARGAADAILGAVLRCAGELPAPEGAVWGVAVPGPFDYAAGVALFRGVGKFDGLYGVDVREALLGGLRGRPSGVVFLNDAHAFAAGEWSAGAARGQRRCVGITLGTGVGSAFLVEGRPCREGPGVPPEGRVDLLRLGGRPLEDSVSRRAIRARYGDPAADVREIAARARAGEARARAVLEATFAALGSALRPCLVAFGAGGLVVGGSMAASWDIVGPALRAGIGSAGVRPAVGSLGGDAPLIGAARAAAGP